ncbi:hypothetical protein ANN_12950 [Periplaneta americana]|uniref:Uncharacterized protein n=1 Tax=Periplaneta americana TaxID=6978 RepID=A0ABQ8TJD8_PERAM|nr:hypothetical protein ANN_12950 [Periplaneta americana]
MSPGSSTQKLPSFCSYWVEGKPRKKTPPSFVALDAPIPAPAECEVPSVIMFLNAQGIAPIEIDRQLCQVFGSNVMSKQMVRCSTRSWIEDRRRLTIWKSAGSDAFGDERGMKKSRR